MAREIGQREVTEDLETARAYRERAAEFRRDAAGIATKSAKTALLSLAEDYERMAKDLELCAAQSKSRNPN